MKPFLKEHCIFEYFIFSQNFCLKNLYLEPHKTSKFPLFLKFIYRKPVVPALLGSYLFVELRWQFNIRATVYNQIEIIYLGNSEAALKYTRSLGLQISVVRFHLFAFSKNSLTLACLVTNDLSLLIWFMRIFARPKKTHAPLELISTYCVIN